MLEHEIVLASLVTRFIKIAAVVACLGAATSGCFWRDRDARDDRHDHDHHDDHRGDHRDDRH